jgi:hypothetical protein
VNPAERLADWLRREWGLTVVHVGTIECDPSGRPLVISGWFLEGDGVGFPGWAAPSTDLAIRAAVEGRRLPTRDEAIAIDAAALARMQPGEPWAGTYAEAPKPPAAWRVLERVEALTVPGSPTTPVRTEDLARLVAVARGAIDWLEGDWSDPDPLVHAVNRLRD